MVVVETLSSKTGRRRRRHHLFDNNERTNGVVVVVGRCLLGRKRSSRLLLCRRRLRKKFCGVERRHIGERENTRQNEEENALKKKKTFSRYIRVDATARVALFREKRADEETSFLKQSSFVFLAINSREEEEDISFPVSSSGLEREEKKR